MYEATVKEREELICSYEYTPELINILDIFSDEVRKGIPIGFLEALAVSEYQTDLQKVRKFLKKWWEFWK